MAQAEMEKEIETAMTAVGVNLSKAMLSKCTFLSSSIVLLFVNVCNIFESCCFDTFHTVSYLQHQSVSGQLVMPY